MLFGAYNYAYSPLKYTAYTLKFGPFFPGYGAVFWIPKFLLVGVVRVCYVLSLGYNFRSSGKVGLCM